MPQKATVCVVDDDDLVRATMCGALEEAGFRVLEAAGGVEGLKKIESEKPAVVVLDIIMPDREGIDIVLEVTRRSPETKILAVSGGGARAGAQDYLELALGLGAHDALAKPFGKKTLAAKVAALVRLAQ
jgi:DNA-binding response OmpR family regulator